MNPAAQRKPSVPISGGSDEKFFVIEDDSYLNEQELTLEDEVYAEELLEMMEEEDALETLELDLELDSLSQAVSGGSSSGGGYGYSNSNGLTPYFDPFFSMFGAFSSQLPSLVVLEMSPSNSDASVNAELAALEQRIEQLEQSNLLLASDFTTNAEAFWDVCTVDVLGLCNVEELQQLPCLASQTAMATECLATNFEDVQVRDCRVGVERMTTWYQVHEADVAASASASSPFPPSDGPGNGAAGNNYYGAYVNTMNSFLNVFIGVLVFMLILRCCIGCALMRRRVIQQRRAAARAKAVSNSEARKQQEPSSPCQERGEAGIVQGVRVELATDAQCAKVEGLYYL
eukprot:INCI15225.1.p1 GENE.INCI15225.1~~INCI15225.1.p1  ORF type:complete len:344 (-),score=70.41 INCI15225.1:276-1307(-)